MADIKLRVGLEKGTTKALKELLERAKKNQAELVKIRNRLRSYQMREMGTTLLTRRVYLNAVDTWEQINMEIEDEVRMDEKKSRDYALSWRAFPVAKQKSTNRVRVATPLMRAKSHML